MDSDKTNRWRIKNIKINTRKFRIRLRRKRNSTVSNGSKRKFRNKRDYLKKF